MAEFNINKWQDLQLNDNDLYTEFMQLWKTGNYSNALSIVENNASLSTKSFVAGALNTISAALTYLQDNYFNNVEDVLAQNLNKFNLAISNFINKNSYNATTQYVINNFVLYNNNVYMCIQNSIGNLPTNTNYWVNIGLKGETGAYGTGMNLKYSWSSTTIYNQYDVVYFNDILYVALQNNSGQNPSTSPVYWNVLLTVPKASLTISQNPPTDPFIGQIWGQIIQ